MQLYTLIRHSKLQKASSRFRVRHNLSVRASTSVGQKVPENGVELTVNYFKYKEKQFKNVPLYSIGCMDETPMQYEMPTAKVIAPKGSKSVPVKTNGKEKMRFTFIPACLANGEKLKAMVILKGLKKVPKIQIPNNVVVTVAKKGSMTSQLMEEWRKEVWQKRGTPLKRLKKSFLIMDSYSAHKEEGVLRNLKVKSNTEAIIVPASMTPLLAEVT